LYSNSSEDELEGGGSTPIQMIKVNLGG